MVSRARSSIISLIPDQGEGHGRDKAINFHESIHEELIQDGNREGHVRELQEVNHREQQVVSKEADLRQMLQTIIDRLPPIHDQDRAPRAGLEHGHKSMNSRQARNARRNKRHQQHQPSQGDQGEGGIRKPHYSFMWMW